MITYKQIFGLDGKTPATNVIQRLSDMAFIPFAPDNTDYQNFKVQINADEAQLEDADGNLLAPTEAKAYILTLP